MELGLDPATEGNQADFTCVRTLPGADASGSFQHTDPVAERTPLTQFSQGKRPPCIVV
jgi:hypothetical protein